MHDRINGCDCADHQRDSLEDIVSDSFLCMYEVVHVTFYFNCVHNVDVHITIGQMWKNSLTVKLTEKNKKLHFQWMTLASLHHRFTASVLKVTNCKYIVRDRVMAKWLHVCRSVSRYEYIYIYKYIYVQVSMYACMYLCNYVCLKNQLIHKLQWRCITSSLTIIFQDANTQKK